VTLAVRGEPGQIGEEDGDLTLLAAAQPGVGRIGAGAGGELLGKVRAEQLVDAL
jgi:hypothetical protein